MNIAQTMEKMGARSIDQLHIYYNNVLVTFHENDQVALSTAMDLLLYQGISMKDLKLELKWKKVYRV